MLLKRWIIYLVSIALGVACGLSDIGVLLQMGSFCSEVFVRIFRCISMPVVSLSVIVALSTIDKEKGMSRVWRKTLSATIGTTLIAAGITAILYCIINPQNVSQAAGSFEIDPNNSGYWRYVLEIIPDSLFSAFSSHKVLSVLLISFIFGISIRYIEDSAAKQTISSFFKGIHSILFTIIRFVINILPIGMFGFIVVSVSELKGNMNFGEMGRYFGVIIVANLVQGLLVLPLWLSMKKINPIRTFAAMFPAISLAFFSKSSSGTLPLTIECAENRLGISKTVSRFTLPLCTTINMNGCATFIFTTVIYLMQNNGTEISMVMILSWIVIATIAAIGNAGIPMGCFFLSASLLSSMDVPIPLMGIILPFYGIMDMLETALNVWSDSCVAAVVDTEHSPLSS
jgi:Na+/H+-dicarboxylate symporter